MTRVSEADANQRAILDRLESLGVRYDLLEHEPVHSIESCAPIGETLKALVLKNLFLTTRPGKGLYLFVTMPDYVFQSGVISRQAGTSRLCFAPEEPLERCLRSRFGAVNALGLIFDTLGEVSLLLDVRLRRAPRLAFHPCRNDRTVALSTTDFLNAFVPSTNHLPLWIDTDAGV